MAILIILTMSEQLCNEHGELEPTYKKYCEVKIDKNYEDIIQNYK